MQPLLGENRSEIEKWFPPYQYAISIPALILVVAIVFITVFISYVFVKEAQKKKSL
jgi:hypothetical protein